MLKLELKRIFSKKINVFAIGLALILAVIFSGFAVTSNRYVDENGNASTGIMATRKLTDNRRAWKGTLTEDELRKAAPDRRVHRAHALKGRHRRFDERRRQQQCGNKLYHRR